MRCIKEELCWGDMFMNAKKRLSYLRFIEWLLISLTLGVMFVTKSSNFTFWFVIIFIVPVYLIGKKFFTRH